MVRGTRVVTIRLLLIPVVLAGYILAADAQKPACTQATQGQVWIERAEHGAPVRAEVCTLQVWRYRWEPATVHVTELPKRQKERKPKREPR